MSHRHAHVVLGGALVVVALIGLSFAFPAEEVDFSLAPPQGLQFKLTEAVKMSFEGTVNQNETEVDLKQSMHTTEVFTQKFVKVKDGKVAEVEREYEEAVTKVKTEMAMLPEPQEQEMDSPLAWKHVRARFAEEGDELKLEVKDGDAWKAAEDDVAKRLTVRELLQPMLPLPAGKKRQGETWELGAKELRDYFGSAFRETDGEASEVEVSGTARLEFADVVDVKGVKCAHIKYTFKTSLSREGTPAIEFNFTGDAHYSLTHRIVIGMKGTGRVKIEGEGEQVGQSYQANLSGDMSVEKRIKILAPDEG